ncbi:hypothetical protein Gotur_019751 [Gossypium turneri]
MLKGRRFLACDPCRPRVQVGPETHKCVGGEVET